MTRRLLVLLLALVALAGCSTDAGTGPGPSGAAPVVARLDPASPPMVIGHRGAAGYRPEHTLASYTLAAEQGADAIEPDLVVTKDGVLVARHETEISATTDVADHPEFASRKGSRTVDGQSVTGWFVEDFTLAELRTLRARERIPDVRPDNAAYDDRFPIPTFAEILELRADLSSRLGRPVAVYPELKHPRYLRGIGLDPVPLLQKALTTAGLTGRDDPVLVQNFEPTALRRLRDTGLGVRLTLLTAPDGAPWDLRSSGDPRTYADLLSPTGLKGLAADGVTGIGPELTQVVDDSGSPTGLVIRAHAAGLTVHPYTFRAENQFLLGPWQEGDPAAYGDLAAQLTAFFRAGVDGVFADQPDLAVKARTAFLQED